MRSRFLLPMLIVGLLATTWSGAAPGEGSVGVQRTATNVASAETFPERVVDGVDRAGYLAKQEQLQAWLLDEMAAGALAAPMSIEVTAADLQALARADAEDSGKTVVGIVKSLGHHLDFSEIGRMRFDRTGTPFQGGILRATDDGGFVWTGVVASNGAHALRLHFDDLRLPSTADLFVFSLEGQAFGPYRDEEFWSNTVFGSTAIVQLRSYEPARRAELSRLSFTVAEVGHIGSKFLPAAGIAGATTRTDTDPGGTVDFGESAPEAESTSLDFCGFNEACVENAQCGGGPSWSGKADAQDATALMLWTQGPFIYTCTGGLVADTDGSSQIPYFLTANHCVSRQKDANSLETHFQFTVGCGSNCPAQWQGGGIQTEPVGAQLLATSQTGDYTLLQLEGTPPAGSVLMGWTTADVANADGTDLFRISHPSTAPQAYSVHSVDTSALTCQGIPRGAWIYSRDVYGATEGGSSGSPVYNASGQIVGQLTGACGYNTGDPCDSASNATIDGAFASYFNDIAGYLDPTPCTPSAESCDDGTDNDCDGAVDCDDSDCTGDPACESGGGCTLGQPGDPCTSNADCCSNKCKGPPSGQTCR